MFPQVSSVHEDGVGDLCISFPRSLLGDISGPRLMGIGISGPMSVTRVGRGRLLEVGIPGEGGARYPKGVYQGYLYSGRYPGGSRYPGVRYPRGGRYPEIPYPHGSDGHQNRSSKQAGKHPTGKLSLFSHIFALIFAFFRCELTLIFLRNFYAFLRHDTLISNLIHTIHR